MAKKGNIPWNKGLELSEEHRRNLSISHSGKPSPMKGSGKQIVCPCGNIFSKGYTKAIYCSRDCYNKYRKVWNKGIKINRKTHPNFGHNREHTEEAKEKISVGHKGLRCGEKNNKWKGGITAQDKLERLRFRREVLKKVLERDNYTCQICRQRGVKLHVDHIKPWSEYVDERFNMDNCRTLCMACHYETTFGKPMPDKITTWGLNLVNGGV